MPVGDVKPRLNHPPTFRRPVIADHAAHCCERAVRRITSSATLSSGTQSRTIKVRSL